MRLHDQVRHHSIIPPTHHKLHHYLFSSIFSVKKCLETTMKKFISAILFAFLFGAAAAFFRPAAPYQVEFETKPTLFPRGGASIDPALDNPDIAEDTNISPARKVCTRSCFFPTEFIKWSHSAFFPPAFSFVSAVSAWDEPGKPPVQ
jgi:hypothetical protein